MVNIVSWFVTGIKSKTIFHPLKKKELGKLLLHYHIEINLNAKYYS